MDDSPTEILWEIFMDVSCEDLYVQCRLVCTRWLDIINVMFVKNGFKREDSDLISLKSIMSSPIITLPSSSTVRQAIQLMRVHKIKHLAVTDVTNNDEGK